MPNGNSIVSEIEQRIRARLRELTARHPQAEIARKAGISKANVHRYLNKNRIPASLCSAIIENLGVNANWLMTGRGQAPRADKAPPEPAGANAASLMELVESMNHAARLNLGALTDKRELKAARELSDTLQRYELTRARLSNLSRDVLRRVLDDWWIAYREMKSERCRTLRESASQLMRLCDDEALRLELLELEAQTEATFGDERKALEQYRHVVTLTLLRPQGLDDTGVGRVNLFLGMAESRGLLREALRMGRATLELVRGTKIGPRPLSVLYMNIGSHSLDLGEIDDAMNALRLSVSTAEAGTRTHEFALSFWTMAQFWAGAATFDHAQSIGKPWWARAESLMLMALWLEDPEAARRALAEYNDDRSDSSAEPNTESITLKHFLRALRKPGAQVATAAGAALRKRQPDETALPTDRFQVEVYDAQVAWHAGQRAAAAKTLERAAQTLAHLPADSDPVMLSRAMYWRLAWRLRANARIAPKAEAARAFFKSMIAKGYARMRSMEKELAE